MKTMITLAVGQRLSVDGPCEILLQGTGIHSQNTDRTKTADILVDGAAVEAMDCSRCGSHAPKEVCDGEHQA